MRKPARGLAAALATVVLMTAVAAAQKVSFDFDKTADFTSLTRFAFREGTKSGNPLVDDRIVAAIASVLTGRGMTRDDASPDVIIVTHLTFEKQKDITAYSTNMGYGAYGWGWGGGWGGTDIRVHEILMGTLIIDMVDAKRQAVVWRGIGVKQVKSQPKASSVDKNVVEAVTKILKNFPPRRNT